MENFKVTTITGHDLKEVLGLLDKLGFHTGGIKIKSGTIYAKVDVMDVYTHVLEPNKYKRTTIQELHDMVKQKEQPMKEFLVKVAGKYELKFLDVCEHPDAVEVPKGSDFAMWYGAELNHIAFYKKFDGGLFVISPNYKTWTKTMYKSIDQIFIENKEIGHVAWQRTPNQITIEEKAPMEECLEFAEELRNMGESGWIEEKHLHYKRDVSHLKSIDPYRIADLYDLHPCAEHIMKKSLCAGDRGHKDLLRDIQDIIDTAERWKEMLKEDEL